MGKLVYQGKNQKSNMIKIVLPLFAGVFCAALTVAGFTVNRKVVFAAYMDETDCQIASDQSGLMPVYKDSNSAQTNASIMASGQNVEFIRQLGGDVSAVSIQGNTAYIGIGPELAMFELQNPGNPDWVGGVVFDADVEAVVITGTLAYVAAGEVGLRVVDISNPNWLNEIRSIEMGIDAIDIAIDGKYVYIAYYNNTRLNVVDISNPISPVLTGSYDLVSERPNKMAVWNNFAYLATSRTLRAGGGVVILDVSNPAASQWKSSYDTPENGVDLMVKEVGSVVYAFVADHPGSLQVLDVTNPDSATLKSTYEFSMPIGSPEPAADMLTSTGYLYLGMSDRSLKILDVSDLTELKRLVFMRPFTKPTGLLSREILLMSLTCAA